MIKVTRLAPAPENANRIAITMKFEADISTPEATKLFKGIALLAPRSSNAGRGARIHDAVGSRTRQAGACEGEAGAPEARRAMKYHVKIALQKGGHLEICLECRLQRLSAAERDLVRGIVEPMAKYPDALVNFMAGAEE